jgi:hypothetical protein
MPDTRFGISLSPLKTRLFDTIKRAGAEGIDGNDLYGIVFGDRERSYHTLKAHVFQINSMLVETEYRIRSRGRRYTLVREAAI